VLDSFPWLPVMAIDTLDHRVAGIQALIDGGMNNLAVMQANATHCSAL
jgi:2-keto-3-deoxy-6-phosphogluconate aldolase